MIGTNLKVILSTIWYNPIPILSTNKHKRERKATSSFSKYLKISLRQSEGELRHFEKNIAIKN